jgi:hypothetical protein
MSFSNSGGGVKEEEARVSDTSVLESGQLGTGDWKARYKSLAILPESQGKDFCSTLLKRTLTERAYPAERCFKKQ